MKKFTLILIAAMICSMSFGQTWTSGSGIIYSNPTTTKVGVGITNPSELFQINGGALKIGNSSSANDRAVNMLKIGDGSYIQIGEWEADDKLSFKANSYNFTGGNVGIGTTNPTQKLHVNGSTIITGSLGVGTSNPLQRLQLGDEFVFHDEGTKYLGRNMYFDASVYNDRKIKNGFSSAIRYSSNSIGLFIYGDGNAGTIVQQTGNITLFANGNVGIGTTNTQNNKLAVKGKILCEGMDVVTNVPSADYVFADNYNLLSLADVAAFIKKYRHLPDIPSAKEFKENGYNMVKMDEILLKKVEELTLYTIDLDKQINMKNYIIFGLLGLLLSGVVLIIIKRKF
jgi:hypothetical protein